MGPLLGFNSVFHVLEGPSAPGCPSRNAHGPSTLHQALGWTLEAGDKQDTHLKS